MARLRTHDVTLRDGDVVLRPMTEDDWEILLPWNQDPEVLYYTEGDDIESWSPEQVREIYRGVSRAAFCFVIEHRGEPVGECWLQEMNLERILAREPGLDCRRIDIMIGEKRLWGKGVGSQAIRMLVRFGFEEQGADAIFGLTSDHNPRSIGAFEKAGLRVHSRIPEPEGSKAKEAVDLVIRREDYSPAGS